MDFLSKNLSVLKVYYPNTWKSLQSIDNFSDIYMETSKNGMPVMVSSSGGRKIVLHSLYDPIKEAERFVKSRDIKPDDNILLYGFGNGYVVESILNALNDDGRLVVFEFNYQIFRKALEVRDFAHIISDRRLFLYVEDDLKDIVYNFENVLNDIIFYGGKVLVHRPSLDSIPEKLKAIKNALEDFVLGISSMEHFESQLNTNLKMNLQDTSHFFKIKDFFGKFNMPIIIISSGPSLDKNIGLLFEAKTKALLISVGTSLKPLLNKGIVADFIVITDPSPYVYEQIRGIHTEIPLIFLPTVNWQVVKYYSGPKIMGIQEGIGVPEELMLEWGPLKTGGSVATTSLDIAIKMGGNPIIFIGQDLAYTNMKTHAEGTIHGERFIEEKFCPTFVKGWGGKGLVPSSKNLSYYRRWIERRISVEEGITFINATEGGAHIEGALDIHLREVLDKLPIIRGV